MPLTRPASRVIFRVAAGPRCGFGHLVRCRSLAQALGIQPRVSVRGTSATQKIASAFGWTVMDVESDERLRALNPELVVIDDPSNAAANAWVRRARRVGVPVATIHDLGRGYAKSDLIVDGSIHTGVPLRGIAALLGPEFAILHPKFAALSRKPQPRGKRVLIALGGGVHVRPLASHLCDAIALRVPGVDLRVARGFASGAVFPVLPAGRWVSAPHGLAAELSQAAAAVVAGGVTLYEACARGVPVVGLAVTSAQHQTIRFMRQRGAAIDGGRPPLTRMKIAHIADAVATLLQENDRRRAMSNAARALIDGHGAARVARELQRLMSRGDKALGLSFDGQKKVAHAA